MSDAENQVNTFERVKTVKDAYTAELMSKANVTGVGIGFRQQGGQRTDSMALIVMVERKLPRSQLSAKDLLPEMIEGVPVDVQEVGGIGAQM